jgi:hypothetical protein
MTRRKLGKEEAILVGRGVRAELEKMRGKRWTPLEEVKEELKQMSTRSYKTEKG